MKALWIILALTFTYSASAAEFKYIKLDPEFERYLMRANGSESQGFVAQKSKESDKVMEGRMREVLLGASSTKKSAFVGAASVSEDPPLYDEIREHLQNSHQQIGLDEITRIDRLNREFNLGKENFSGFSWQKPFGTVQVHVDRQVTPNLYTEGPQDQWLIQDTFTFEIEATTYLESLREAKLARMSAREVGAFAGVTFKRMYTYYHYAPTYQAGLTADLSKLFLPFTRFNQRGIENLGHNEIIKREDKFTAKAGGLITTPPIYNVSFSAGILAEADMELMTSVQGIHATDPNGRRFTIGSRGKSTKKTGAVLQLQLDFFKLLKLTLIRAEMNYEYTKSREFTLGFTQSQWQAALAKPETQEELKTLWQGFTEIRDLEPYVVRLEEGQSESVEAHGNILLWGRMDKSKHETNRIIKDGEVHLFHKTYMQDTKFVENLLSRIFSEFLYKLLKLPVGTKNVAIYDKRLTMEYRANHPQAENSNIQRVRSAEDLSFKITRSLEVASKSYIDDAIWFVSEFTSLPSSYKSDLKRGRLKVPVRLESHLRVEQEGFKYFQSRSVKDIFGSLVKVCKSKNLSKWQDDVERIRMLKASHSKKEDSCVQVIGSLYMIYLNDYQAYYEMPSLAHFRKFLMEYINALETIGDLSELFGDKNVFLNGEITASYPNGGHFRDVFSRGQFRGYGVIDNFKRAGGTGTPASITSE